jgi:hypothetical protein
LELRKTSIKAMVVRVLPVAVDVDGSCGLRLVLAFGASLIE